MPERVLAKKSNLTFSAISPLVMMMLMVMLMMILVLMLMMVLLMMPMIMMMMMMFEGVLALFSNLAICQDIIVPSKTAHWDAFQKVSLERITDKKGDTNRQKGDSNRKKGDKNRQRGDTNRQ